MNRKRTIVLVLPAACALIATALVVGPEAAVRLGAFVLGIFLIYHGGLLVFTKDKEVFMGLALLLLGAILLVFSASATSADAQSDRCPNDGREGVYLYGRQYFRGYCLFTEGNIRDFAETALPEGPSSICALPEPEWKIYLFSEPDYGGEWTHISRCETQLQGPFGSLQASRRGTAPPINTPGPVATATDQPPLTEMRPQIYLPFASVACGTVRIRPCPPPDEPTATEPPPPTLRPWPTWTATVTLTP